MPSKHAHYSLHVSKPVLQLMLLACCCLTLCACEAAQLSSPTSTQPHLEDTASAPATKAPEQPIPSIAPSTPEELEKPVYNQPVPQSNPTAQTQPTLISKPRHPPSGEAWKDLTILPVVTDTAHQVFLRGLSSGRNPHAFSKIGDCQSITTYFLALFDNPGFYNLGDHAYLQETIDWYSGSFKRESLAVKGGLNAAAMLSPLRADPKSCQDGESPLACELRIHNPSLALISLEEWWADDPTKYENYIRQIIEYTLSQDILPILATKADNLEGNHQINQTIALLAWEYDLPLWNFWLAVQPLPNYGLVQMTPDGKSDQFHLTHSSNFYDYTNPQAMQSGWAMRNLTALQTLHVVQRALNDQAMP